MVRWPDAKFEVTREEGDNKETERPAGGQYANRAAFGGTIRKPRGLRGDNTQTERPSEACGGTIAKLRKTCEEVSKRRKKKQREDNSETAKDMRRSFEACGNTIATLRKTCEEVWKRRKKKQRREKRLGRN